MNANTKGNPYIGSNVDAFFAEEGLLEEIEAAAVKRIIALELLAELQEKHMTKTELARRLDTSRSQVDRILDPNNESITLNTLVKAAALLGKRLHVSLEPAIPF
jgi:DNA-binding Xre family transcriptional regulator